MKIIFVGAHGTGKSTLVNKLNETLQFPVVESVSRQCQQVFKKLGLEPYGDHQQEYQLMTSEFAFWDYERIHNWDMDCIMARCPIDVVAYMTSNEDHRWSTYMDKLIKMKDEGLFENCIFFYLPIEFPLIDDGCRPMDPEYQKTVDRNMRGILSDLKITPIPIWGSVEERVEQCLKHLSDNKAFMNDQLNELGNAFGKLFINLGDMLQK